VVRYITSNNLFLPHLLNVRKWTDIRQKIQFDANPGFCKRSDPMEIQENEYNEEICVVKDHKYSSDFLGGLS